MPAKKNFTKINLVPEDEFDKSTLGKVLKWALSAGKSIVILTEFVVILAFLSRFKLDRDLNDASEELMQKQLVAESMVDTETEMRSLQERLLIVEKAKASSIGVSEMMNELQRNTPMDVVFESIKLSSDSIVLEGVAGSELGFAKLTNWIKESGNWDTINLGEVEFNQRKGGVIFKITAKLSNKVEKE